MARSKKAVDPRWAPVPDAMLDHFAPPGILDAADVEAATQRFKKALLERARCGVAAPFDARSRRGPAGCARQSSQWHQRERPAVTWKTAMNQFAIL